MSWKGNHGDNWPEWRLDMLRKLWADPANSTVTIARKLGVTKNACVGKAHRLDLARRANPIKSKDPAATNRKRQLSLKATILSGDHKSICRRDGAHAVKEARQRSETTRQKSNVVQFKPPRVITPANTPNPFKTCQFIAGSGQPWSKCGAPSVPGHSWCAEHCCVVYQPRAAE
jgi:GcrA cell cycle regulator